MNFVETFSADVQIPNFVKIRPMRAKLFRADGRTDRHAEAFRNFGNARQVLTEIF